MKGNRTRDGNFHAPWESSDRNFGQGRTTRLVMPWGWGSKRGRYSTGVIKLMLQRGMEIILKDVQTREGIWEPLVSCRKGLPKKMSVGLRTEE